MNSRLNAIYLGMKYRCCNPSDARFKNYGARGITVCDEWLDPSPVGKHCSKGWLAFKKWAFENGYSKELTLDRIDNNKGYFPGNCRWVNMKSQQNNRRNNHLVTYKGETKTLSQWCEELGLKRSTTTSRLVTMKWSVEKAFEQNVKTNNLILYKGKKQNLTEWCKELNLNYAKVYARIYVLKWSVARSFEE